MYKAQTYTTYLIRTLTAFTWPDNKYTYFFKGNQYWRFNQNKETSDDYPKLIKDGWAGIPDDLDAGECTLIMSFLMIT